MRYLKVKVIGDSTVGKTSLLSRWYHQNYPPQDEPGQKQRGNSSTLPPVLESFFVNTTVNSEAYIVTFWDTCTMRSFNDMDVVKLKPLEYEDTDVFIACFDISNPKSFQNISTVWVPEMRYYVPGTPLVVVGNKADLRSSDSLQTLVSCAKGLELAKRLDAEYLEMSAVTCEGLKEVIDTALRIALSRPNSVENKPKRKFAKFNDNPDKVFSKLYEPPSLPRQVPEEIVISIPASTYSSNMRKLLVHNSADCSDFTINFDQCSIPVHRIVLCMAGEWFRNLLLNKTATETELKGLLIPHLSNEEDQKTVRFEAFKRFLEFIYTLEFAFDQKSNQEVLKEVSKMARASQLSELIECCTNVLNKEDYLNSKICRLANEHRRQTVRDLFVNKPTLSDVTFSVEGRHVFAHKAIVMARCDVMAAMLGGAFKEGSTAKEPIPIAETTEDGFLDLLEYLYTDALAERPSSDYRQLLVLSDRFCLPRLRAVCELYISNQVKKEIRKKLNLSTDTCRIILHTLLFAEYHNATQLYKWCCYIITIYYANFEKLEDLALLKPQVRAYLENHRWPPLSYLAELEEFKRRTNR
ncbi:rho-related protein racA [Exaiptasia diaphana]|uniref:BTB domain-containing protein n=1 Tax=Exaiptasia diaphana TaxID=2652724 RepID=A0A913WW97_EXADI|nr:rho-related protein racA [Exaiptasia diaphana]